MKLKFCDYIKQANIGETFYAVETGNKYILIKKGKKNSLAFEFNFNGIVESVEWQNDDEDEIITA